MRVHIKKNVSSIYLKNKDKNPNFTVAWYVTLKEIEDKWLDVDTKFLFSDQFNVEFGNRALRVFSRDIDKIEDDIRENRVICTYCNYNSSKYVGKYLRKTCSHCKKSGSLKKII